MIEILIPMKKGRKKSTIRGFWKDENGKICYDYLRVKVYRGSCLSKKLDDIKFLYKQKAIAYKKTDSFVIYSDCRQSMISNRACRGVIPNKVMKYYIKTSLKTFNGITIYKSAVGEYHYECYYDWEKL